MIIIIDDDAVQRLLVKRAISGLRNVLVPETAEEIDDLPTDPELVIVDRHMTGDWKKNRDEYLKNIPSDRIVEWTIAHHHDDFHKLPGTSHVITKSGTGREVLELIKSWRVSHKSNGLIAAILTAIGLH